MEQWAQSNQLDTQRYAVYQADISDIDSACAAGQACLDQQGLPDIVIANAGISWGVDTSHREDLAAMQQVLATNTMGVAASFQPLLPLWWRVDREVWSGLPALPVLGASWAWRLLRQQGGSHCLLRKS